MKEVAKLRTSGKISTRELNLLSDAFGLETEFSQTSSTRRPLFLPANSPQSLGQPEHLHPTLSTQRQQDPTLSTPTQRQQDPQQPGTSALAWVSRIVGNVTASVANSAGSLVGLTAGATATHSRTSAQDVSMGSESEMESAGGDDSDADYDKSFEKFESMTPVPALAKIRNKKDIRTALRGINTVKGSGSLERVSTMCNSGRNVEVFGCRRGLPKVKGGAAVQGGASTTRHLLVRVKPFQRFSSASDDDSDSGQESAETRECSNQHWTFEIRKGSDFDDCRDCKSALQELQNLPTQMHSSSSDLGTTDAGQDSSEGNSTVGVKNWSHDLRCEVVKCIRAGLDNDKIIKAIRSMISNGSLPSAPLPGRQQLTNLRRNLNNRPLNEMAKKDPYFAHLDEKALEDHLRERSLESGRFSESVKRTRAYAAACRAHTSDPSEESARAVKRHQAAMIHWFAADSTTGLGVVDGVTNGNEMIVIGVVHSELKDGVEQRVIGWFFTNMLMMMSMFLAILKHGPLKQQLIVDGTYNVVSIKHVSFLKNEEVMSLCIGCRDRV